MIVHRPSLYTAWGWGDDPSVSCHCEKGESYEDCCQPYIAGEDLPATAETLMRSRYSAYVVSEIDYIATTHEAKTRDDVVDASGNAFGHRT